VASETQRRPASVFADLVFPITGKARLVDRLPALMA